MAVRVAQLIFGIIFIVVGGLAIWQGVQPDPYGGIFGKTTGLVAGASGTDNPLASSESMSWKWNAFTIGGIVGVVFGAGLALTSKKSAPEVVYY